MALQNDDLLLVNRGGDSFKTKYSEVKGEFVEVAGDNMTGDLTLGTDPSAPNISLNAADGSITAGTYNTLTVGLGGGSVSKNTAVGKNALAANTTGTDNTAVGHSALAYNTTGFQNTALGHNALVFNTEGNYNTAVGLSALQTNTEGTYNTALGRFALYANTTGTHNTAVGLSAGYYIEGDNNTILGAYQGTTADASLSDTVIISAGPTERMRIDSSGSLLFGGTLPSAPNITLNADGSAVFASYIVSGAAGFDNNGDGTIRLVQSDSAGKEWSSLIIKGDPDIDSAALSKYPLQIYKGGNQVGDLVFGVQYDGSATFAGNVTLPGGGGATQALQKQEIEGLISSGVGNGQINVNPGTGLSASGTNATANQSGNTTRTLSLDTTYADGRYVPRVGATMTGALTTPTVVIPATNENATITENAGGYVKIGITKAVTNYGAVTSVYGGDKSGLIEHKALAVISPLISYWTDTNQTTSGNGIGFSWANFAGERLLNVMIDYNQSVPVVLSDNNNIHLSWSSPSIYGLVDNVISMPLGTASDYRLKENITPISDASDLVKQLKPCTFTMKETKFKSLEFKQDPSVNHGFIAHEIGEVIPDAEVGTKDDPDMLGSVNLYPVVSVLTKALQETLARVEALEAKVTSLEGG